MASSTHSHGRAAASLSESTSGILSSFPDTSPNTPPAPSLSYPTACGPPSVSAGGAAARARPEGLQARSTLLGSSLARLFLADGWMVGDEMKVAFRAWAGRGGRGTAACLRVVVDPAGGSVNVVDLRLAVAANDSTRGQGQYHRSSH